MHKILISFLNKHKIIIIIFFIALLARSVLFAINFSANNYDLVPTIRGDDGYYELSKNLIEGHGFSGDATAPFTPYPLRTPLYPLFIAGLLYVFKSYWAVLIVQILIGSTIPLLAMRIVNKIVPSIKTISITVGVLLAIEPYGVLFSSIFYTETIFIFLFLIFLLFFIDYFKNNTHKNAALVGLFLGLATLAKPTVQYLPVVIPFFILFHFRKNITKQVILQIVIFVFIFMATISPWLHRNYKAFGVVGMSAQPAYNLYIYLVPTVLSIENKTNFATELNNVDENKITLATSDHYIAAAVNILKEHPTALLKSIGNTSVAFFTHDGMLTVLMNAGYTPSSYLSKPAMFLLFASPGKFWDLSKTMIMSPLILVLLMRIIWIIITLLALFGVARLFISKKIDILVGFAVFLVAYFVVTTAVNGLGVNARFRMPVNLFIFMFAIYGYLSMVGSAKAFVAKKQTPESL